MKYRWQQQQSPKTAVGPRPSAQAPTQKRFRAIGACYLAPFLGLTGWSCAADELCGQGTSDSTLIGTLEDDGAGSTLVEYSQFVSSPNNDCSVSGQPVSLTLEGSQTSTGRKLVLCLPRPNDLNQTFELSNTSLVRAISITAELSTCLLTLDASRPIVGTATFSGVCDAGVDPAGYSLRLEARLPVTLVCDELPTSTWLAVDDITAVAPLL